MTETQSKRRGWVKNAAIIFLAVMLVLTFFSNTFLNRSLPEVAAQYPTSGSINLKIRGTGTVSSNEVQKVAISESRKVTGIAVRVGDEVTKGQAMFRLAETESTELAGAKEQLETMELAYQKALLDATVPGDNNNYDVQRAQLALTEAMERRDKAKQFEAEKKPLEEAVEAASKKLADVINNSSNLPEKIRLDAANEALETAKAAQEKAKADFDYYAELHGVSSYGSLADDIDKLLEERDALEEQYDELRDNIRDARNRAEAARGEITDAQRALEDTITEAAVSVTSSPRPSQQIEEIQQQYTAAKQAWDTLVAAQYDACVKVETANGERTFIGPAALSDVIVFVSSAQYGDNEEADGLLKTPESLSTYELEHVYRSMVWWHLTLDAAEAYQAAADDYDTADAAIQKEIDGYMDQQRDLDRQLDAKDRQIEEKEDLLDNRELSSAYEAVQEANEDVKRANDAVYDAQLSYNDAIKFPSSNVKAAQDEYDKAKEQLDALSNGYSGIGSYADEMKNVLSAQEALETVYQQQAAANVDDQKEELDFQKQKRELEEQRKTVEELTKNASETIIYAPCDGRISAVNVSAGDTTVMDQPMAEIELTDKGHTLEFEVTKEQASRVNVGDQAEITGRWGVDIIATLVSVKNSKDNPGQNMVLTFEMKGEDVVAGQTLTLSVGQKSQNYEVIVPNSAVKKDSEGDFVLTVVAKNTPLGNRFYVKRVNVEVLASDDNNSALRGDVSSSEFVIITATAPIADGDMVRLPE